MATILGRSVGVLLAAFAASNAIAQPVTLSVASGTAAITSQTNSGGAWTVVIHVTAGSPAVFTVTTATANVVVEQIEVECDADCLMTVNESGSGTFSEIRSIVEKATSSPESFDIDSIVFSGLLGPGVVAAEAIDEIQIGGDLTATVTAGPRASSADSDITSIDVGGDVLGSIYALHGSIGSVDVAGGIEFVDIDARDGITFLSAEYLNFAEITANKGPTTPTTGTISRFELRSDGMVGSFISAHTIVASASVGVEGIFIDGDVGEYNGPNTGIVIFDTLVHPIEITGTLFGGITVLEGGLDHGSGTSGDITIYGDVAEPGFLDFSTPALGSDGFIRTLVRIGGSFGLPSESLAFLEADGLVDGASVGQVIINALGGGEWNTGVAYIDGNQLSPNPHYTNEDLVGAVGQVPFALHDGDCEPENTQTTASSSFIDLAFYGPVTWDPMEGLPFTIEWREWTGSTWTSWTDDSAFWDINNSPGTRWVELIYVDGSDPSVIPGGRQYRITPVLTGDNALLCDDLLTVSDVAVDDFTYVFETP